MREVGRERNGEKSLKASREREKSFYSFFLFFLTDFKKASDGERKKTEGPLFSSPIKNSATLTN